MRVSGTDRQSLPELLGGKRVAVDQIPCARWNTPLAAIFSDLFVFRNYLILQTVADVSLTYPPLP